jgi:glycosyltransferase involved in cell wall biosynthesis
MTIGFYSPLPPARSGVADYSNALLNTLRTQGEVRVNSDGDINLYHLGNNQLHAGIYAKALSRPGVVVLHDAVLHHFALGYFSRQEYVEEFVYNYGEWNRGVAESLWANRSRSAGDSAYFGYPMLRRIVENSRSVIVHNPAAAAIVHNHFADANVVEIPHLYNPDTLSYAAEAERFRTELSGRPVFGVFGHLRESKRILTVLRLISKLTDCTLLLAGDMASGDLQRACEPYLNRPNVRRIGYMSTKEYRIAALAVDLCINLRYPAAGESSGVSVGLMGAGKAVLMTDSLENSPFPEGTCIKISSGIREAAELEAILEWARTEGRYLREIGANAERFIDSEHRIDRVARLYRQALAVH